MYFESATKVFTASVQCYLNQRQETFFVQIHVKAIGKTCLFEAR